MLHWKSCLLGVITILLLHACKKNDTANNTTEMAVNDAATVVASVRGIVVNENNIPVQGAAVSCGTATTTTDMYGMFNFNGIPVSKNNGYVNVKKAGYFNGNRSFKTTAGHTQDMRIKLLPKTITGTFAATTGGTVTLATGGKVTFVSNSITDAGGVAYTGTVNVVMTWINPTAADLSSIMPGDLRGITTDGYERVLQTYGMLGVEITGAGGQPLKIAAGKNAELSVPIPAALLASAPATIPLWHFDESKGRWIEEGTGTKVGTAYIGKVKHFSFWNWDVALQGITLCVNVTDQNNQPLSGATVIIKEAGNPASVGYGLTDALGNVCGLVPKNEALVLEVIDRCSNTVYTQNIGPYTADASINIVATVAPNTLTITGTVVNCSNTPVTNGSVLIHTDGGYYYSVAANSSGVFSLPILNCSSNNTIQFTVLPVDNTSLQHGNNASGSGITGTVAMGNLQACAANAQEYINLLVDGEPHNWAPPYDTISTFGGGGGFGYTFSCNTHGIDNVNTSTYNFVDLVFNYNNIIGPAPFQVSVNYYNAPLSTFYTSQTITSPANPQLNLTAIGTPITGFLEGNFNVTMLFQPGNITRNVVGSFKVKRP